MAAARSKHIFVCRVSYIGTLIELRNRLTEQLKYPHSSMHISEVGYGKKSYSLRLACMHFSKHIHSKMLPLQ